MVATAAPAAKSANRAWLRTLELTAPIIQNPRRLLADVIEEWAAKQGDAPALLSKTQSMSYGALSGRMNQATRWALDRKLGKGDTVCLLMPNCPDYLPIWLGIARTGCTVALLNTNLKGESLDHAIRIAAPKAVIISAESFAAYEAGGLNGRESDFATIQDRALLIYTSGTTGLPKAANISHGRILQWSYWFAGLLETAPSDRLYNCLPLYHSTGGIVAMGMVLASGGLVVVSERFSASQFWSDIAEWDCTLFQYIGELCRYLLNTKPQPHRLRLACGNGLRADVWETFQQRCKIPRILEFYASTEGNVSFFNVEGKPGSIGRIPRYLAHRFPAALVKMDASGVQPARDPNGRCMEAAADEAGEAIGLITESNRFEGYANPEESEKKILRNVFRPGDAWFRTGDLLRRDEQGFFYFMDRIGDTYRWKGENVSTTEVENAICSFPGVQQACVYGVAMPGIEGKAGLAVIPGVDGMDMNEFGHHLRSRLPEYAIPLILRFGKELELTPTFKHTRAKLGFDPALTTDPLYFYDREQAAFLRLDQALFDLLSAGKIRL